MGADNQRLWHSPDAELSVWLNQPHQNLAVVEAAVGDLDTYLSSLARVAGVSAPSVPSFGPFRFPPAEQFVAVSGGEDWAASVDIYPSIALSAKTAGRLVGNPWLSGGTVVANGRPTQIRWQGSQWQVGDLSRFATGVKPATEEMRAILGRLRFGPHSSQPPPGDYDILVAEGDLWMVRKGEAIPQSSFASESGEVALALRESDASGWRMLLLLPTSGEFPRLISMAAGVERWPLPGERLLDRLGWGVETTRFETTRFEQIEAASYQRQDLQPALDMLPGLTDRLQSRGRTVYIEAGATVAMSRHLARDLDQVPIIGEGYADYWRAVADLLEPLGTAGIVEASIGDETFLRLHRD